MSNAGRRTGKLVRFIVVSAFVCLCVARRHACLVYAGGVESGGFVPEINLPADELPHPDKPVEWWYFSGHLEDAEGGKYGVMAAFFRSRFGAFPENHFMIHSLLDKGGGRFHSGSVIEASMIDMMKAFMKAAPKKWREKIHPDSSDPDSIARHHEIMEGRPEVGSERLEIRYGKNFFGMTKGPGGGFTEWEYTSRISGAEYELELTMRPLRGPMYVGGTGNVGVKKGEDMYYYSFTRLDARGTLTLNGAARPVRGLAWYDHQFGAFTESEGPAGWDWFSVQLEDGTDLNVSALRRLETGERFNRLATVQYGDGGAAVARDLTIEELGSWESPDTGITYPSGWRLALPSLKATLTVKPAAENQEMRTFGPIRAIWEGACTVEADIDGARLAGLGYTELVGYAFPVDEKKNGRDGGAR
ncbi:MAG: lipocalin family protein [bacterium]